MLCKSLITIRLLLYISCFHKAECAPPSFTVPLSTTPLGSVDENASKDVSILTVEGEDTDGDILSFSMVSQTPTSPPFLLDASSGLLMTPTGLDADYSLRYSFIFGVSDGSTTVNSVTYTLNINDINEFTPAFQETTNNTCLLDTVSNGYLVVDVNATDADVTATVTYILLSGNSPVTFSLDSSNGKITVLNSTQLDPTSTPSYSLIIQASDGTHTVNLTVSITVKGAAPSFIVPLSITPPWSVDENSSKDVSILTVEGVITVCDVLTFSIVSQTPTSPPFLLDASSGLLKTPTGLDAENSLTYSFIFGVSDGSTTVNSVNFTVYINDINEFTPAFHGTTKSASLLDSVSNGYLVYDANATDEDATATVTYSLISGNSPVTFSLDSSNGKITVFDSTQLDPTLTPSYSLIIQASDGADTVTMTLPITVNEDFCSPSPCANSGTCCLTRNSYTCTSEYTGQNCTEASGKDATSADTTCIYLLVGLMIGLVCVLLFTGVSVKYRTKIRRCCAAMGLPALPRNRQDNHRRDSSVSLNINPATTFNDNDKNETEPDTSLI